MKHRVITVSREFGGGGAEIAQKLASKLGWKLLDRALVEQIAQSVKIDPELAHRFDERVDPWLHRVARNGMWSGAFEAVSGPEGQGTIDAATMTSVTSGILLEAYEQGDCVIVGRGAQCALSKYADVFHIFVYANLAVRIERVRHRADAPPNLRQWIAEMDLRRADYIRHHFGCDWANPHLYDLMIDSTIGYDASVAVVLAALQFVPDES